MFEVKNYLVGQYKDRGTQVTLTKTFPIVTGGTTVQVSSEETTVNNTKSSKSCPLVSEGFM